MGNIIIGMNPAATVPGSSLTFSLMPSPEEKTEAGSGGDNNGTEILLTRMGNHFLHFSSIVRLGFGTLMNKEENWHDALRLPGLGT